MRASYHPEIRETLRTYTEGLTAKDIAAIRGISVDAVRRSLVSMPDAYIDRWAPTAGPKYSAVWCIVTPPPNCPYPVKNDKRR